MIVIRNVAIDFDFLQEAFQHLSFTVQITPLSYPCEIARTRCLAVKKCLNQDADRNKMTRKDPLKRATLKTVADLTGLSPSTVSLSLRNGGNVSPQTREKIAQAAKIVGYVPNRAGVRLRTGRTNVFSLVLSTDNNSIDFTRMLIQGIGSHLEGTRFHLNVVPEIATRDPLDSVRYVLENRSSDGIILTHTTANDPRVEYLLDAGFPFVCHGRTAFQSPHAFHDFNVEKLVRTAVTRLVDLGRKNLLLISLDNVTTNFANTVATFESEVAKAGATGRLISAPEHLASAKDARRYAETLARDFPEFDGIICINELLALAFISGLQESGQVLGREYDLVCRQTTDILPTLYPDIDTISEDLFATGEELAKLLIKVVAGEDVRELKTFHEPKLCWRKS